MIVNDKRFASMLDKKVKNGYELLVRDEEVCICGGGWLLAGEMHELGRETLAVLVKHLGYIPRNICCTVFKAKDEYMTQGLTEETFAEQRASFETGEPMEQALYTGLRMGHPLYQLPDRRILSVKLASGIVEVSTQNGSASGTASVCWMDDDSCVWFRAYRPSKAEEHYPKWEALEKIWWPDKSEV